MHCQQHVSIVVIFCTAALLCTGVAVGGYAMLQADMADGIAAPTSLLHDLCSKQCNLQASCFRLSIIGCCPGLC